MKYAISYTEYLSKTFIVEADSLEEAEDKVWNNRGLIDLDHDDYDDCTVEVSKYAKPGGIATENQLRLCEELEVLWK